MSDLPGLKGFSAAADVITPTLASLLLRIIRCSRLRSHAFDMLFDVYSGQCSDALALAASDHPVPLGFLPCGLAHGQNCSDALASVYPVPTGSGAHAPVYLVPLTFAEPIHFFISLSSFFMFCFAWPFCFIPGTYNYSLDKLISPIDCVVIQSPKSQSNGLMEPFSLQSPPFW